MSKGGSELNARHTVIVSCLALLILSLVIPPHVPQVRAQAAQLSSVRSGRWSDPGTWSVNRLPSRGDSVVVSSGHQITYDMHSDIEIGRLLIQGSLLFARDRSTRLDVGNVIVDRGGYLEVGAPGAPVPAGLTAEIRFVTGTSVRCTGGTSFVEGDIGLWVLTGGRWEANGAPVRVTWTKLAAPAQAGASVVRVADDVSDWPVGATVVVTPTDLGGRDSDQAAAYPQYEEFQITGTTRGTGYTDVRLSGALRYPHDAAGNAVGEVALLSRNVVLTAKYPNNVQNGHTMYFAGSRVGITYTEFRRLGDFGCAGRYPVHYHMMGDTSRGLRLLGASIWRSDNNFLNIHGSSGITIEDTVGYDATGVGFFVGEPAPGIPSVDNVLVGNLAARVVYRQGALLDPADSRFRASGFWIHSYNSALIGNVASGAWSLSFYDSGFHLAEQMATTRGYSTFLMVRNEAHSNNGAGLFSWSNSDTAGAIVDFRSWRNGNAGFRWGAYDNQVRVHRALLFENGVFNLETTILSTYLVDSQLFGTSAYPTAYGLMVDGYFLANSPASPAAVFRTTFSGHQVDVSQDHSACSSSADELNPLSASCAAVYLVLGNDRFNSARPFDFGWHRNANSWWAVNGYGGTMALPANFRLTRRDRPRPDTDAVMNTSTDSWLDPLSAPVAVPAAPPQAVLLGLTDNAALPASVSLQVNLLFAASPIARVVYYVDERAVATQTAPPFTFTWTSSGWTRRWAHLYAALTDANGNTGYTQVVRLQRSGTATAPAPAPAPTPAPTATPTPTPTPRPTATPTPAPTPAPTPTPTPTPAPTPTPTPAPTPLPPPVIKSTPKPEPTPTQNDPQGGV